MASVRLTDYSSSRSFKTVRAANPAHVFFAATARASSRRRMPVLV
jgi:hypothetical protein